MKESGFRFQKVLDVKQHAEDRQKLLVANARRVCSREEARLEHLRALHAQRCEETSRRENGRVDVHELARERAHLDSLAQQVRRQARTLAHAKNRLADLVEQLVKCRTERKVLEKLKERRLEEQAKELQRRERKSADEVGARAYVRRTRNP